MSFRPFCVLPFFAALIGSLTGCTPKIGNACTISTDCSQLGDRLCDGTQPGGYCTVFNCEPDGCPDSICVAFDPKLDPACQNADQGRSPRFERTFCLKPCGANSDCRDGYACVDLSDPNSRSHRRAQVVDTGANDGGLGYGVCMALATSPDGGFIPEDAGTGDLDAGAVPAVCTPFTGFPKDGGVPWTPFDGGS